MPVDILGSGGGPIVRQTYNPPPAPTLGYGYISAGERWDAIAYKMYGDSTLITPLIQFNPGVPIDDVIPSGTEVFVPLLVLNAPQTTSTPWG